MNAPPPMLPDTMALSPRTVEMLALGPGAWYVDHLARRSDCWCSVDGPDRLCDAGEALWRLLPAAGAVRS